MRSRFSPASATSCGKLVIRSAGAACACAEGSTICGRAEASAPLRGEAGERICDADEGADAIDDTVAAGAPRDAALDVTTGEVSLFGSSIRIASSGVGMSAT